MSESTKHYRCRHIFTDGHRCGSKSLRNETFCYYHHNACRPLMQRHENVVPNRKSTFDLPAFEDRTAVQSAIHLVAARLATNQLDSRRAGLLLYAMQIALQTHPRLPIAAPVPPEDLVNDITLHPTLGHIAPESEFNEPEPEKGFADAMFELSDQESKAALLNYSAANPAAPETVPAYRTT